MITRYDVLSSRWSSQFGVKIHVFSTSFNNIQYNIVAKIMQNVYLCVIFHVKHKKLPFLAVFTWFPILGRWRPLLVTSQASSSATTHKIYFILLRRSWQRLSTKSEIVSIRCNVLKTPGRGSINPPPPPCTTVGVWICLFVRGLRFISSSQLRNNMQLWCINVRFRARQRWDALLDSTQEKQIFQ